MPELELSVELGQAVINVVAFFMPAFMAMIAIEWAVGLFRRD